MIESTRRFILTLLALGSAFAGQAQSVNIELLYNWTNPALPGSAAFANVYNECWGVAQGGREYAIIGTTYGTHFFDVTDPDNVVQVDSVEGAFTGPGVIHRDYHDYAGYLYAVCDEGSGTSTLQIIDMQYLPDSVQVVYDGMDKLSTAHNIFIDSVRARLYAFIVGFAPGFSSVAMFGLEDPTDPQLIKVYNAGSQVHDGYVEDGLAYLNDGFNGRFLIMDWSGVDSFSDEPVVLGSLDSYPDQGYNHSGWLHEDGDLYVFADENPGLKMKAVDVSDPSDPTVLSTFNSGVDPMSIAHNQIFLGDYLFTAHYHDGLYIHDLSDPVNPVELASYKTYQLDDHFSYRGAWGVYPFLPSGNVIVSDMQYGLFLFRVTGLSTGVDAPVQPMPFAVTAVGPNPLQERLRISATAEAPVDAVLELLDLKGQRVVAQNWRLASGENTAELPVPADLPAGLYILRLEAEGNEGPQRFTEQLVNFAGR
jgi:choice-of-anchor B domain-containing protein